MAKRKAFLVRLPEELLGELNLWARDELRSLNAQIEYLLREQLRRRRKAGESPPNQEGASNRADQENSGSD